MSDKITKDTSFGFRQIDSREKSKMVGNVFDTVASNYDLMNDLMSFGIHRLWKRVAIESSSLRKDSKVLDLAGGTGDMVKLMRDKVGEEGLIVLSDINRSMLEEGRDRLINDGVEGINIAQIDAQFIPFKDETFDLITIAFGLRNVTDKDKAMRSMRRALKKGGKLIVLEFSKPTNEIFREIYDVFSFEIIPKIGELIANTEESYRYLAESIAGFKDCNYENLTNGVVAIHSGVKG